MTKRIRNLYNPLSDKPFKISRSSIELFHECPRCFYIDRKLGVGRPPGFPFNLNSAVDSLLKKEFDIYRSKKEPHPLMISHHIKAIPFEHPELEKWRENFVGIQYHHEPTNLTITGAVDDLWINEREELIVVDYKSTSKNSEITSLNEDWHGGYKRQMEVYQWLLLKKGFPVSPTCYWVYANGDKTPERFDATLKFRMTVIPYHGKTDWVEKMIHNIKTCLESQSTPPAATKCTYCSYLRELDSLDLS